MSTTSARFHSRPRRPADRRAGRPAQRLSGAAALLLGLVLALVALPGLAGSLGVNPIRVGLSERQPTAAITLNNTGSTPMIVQMQVSRWTAEAEDDHYAPSEDVLVTPPIVSIAPGQSQIVRVGLSGEPDAARELAYRLFIEEVPPPQKDGYQGLQVALRLGLPLFVAPAAAVRPQFEWSATRSADQLMLKVSNVGAAHARLLDVKLHPPGGGEPLASRTAPSYLLPGQTRLLRLDLDPAWAGRQVRLSAATDRGTTEAELEVPVH